MKLVKRTFDYKGEKYPLLEVDLTKEELKKHNVSSSSLFFTCDNIFDIMHSVKQWGKEESEIYCSVDFFFSDRVMESYFKGEINEGTMKFFLGRIIIEFCA